MRAALSCSAMSNSLRPVKCLCPLGFSRQEYWSGLPCPPPGDLPNPGIEPRSPTLQVDSLPSEPPGKPKNTGVGSLSFLQGIFPTQESNWGLQHCRQIFYWLSYQGSPLEVNDRTSIKIKKLRSTQIKNYNEFIITYAHDDAIK